MTVTDIGYISALYCLTPRLECCSDSETPNAARVTREWYLPDGRPLTSDNSPFIKNRVSSAVSLQRDRFSFNVAPSGVYHCEIPDTSGTRRNVYIGIYSQRFGEMNNNYYTTLLGSVKVMFTLLQVLLQLYLYCLTETRLLLPALPLVVLLPLSLGGRMVSQWTTPTMSKARD